ncbi:DUF2634 domain-containing protein [Paenibacillus popilliae]|uniref:DUF2634 domain-containing protein n=1 Tax=Paenibacillus popilliae ATCC 14706 TaxID=1212764 RepID=M9M0H1_PAEPP|nr:DUF2634 domain-containing protein [Paenibacillus popilliae]GAC42269.1 hypothetical protein PPOP_1626 [Paenibacillus popilliae ATCC 14706]
MIPDVDAELLDEPLDDEPSPSLTWKLDLEKGRVVGKTDGLEAIKQAVFKVFQTDRFWHDIYTSDYGHELTLLLGSSPVFAQSEAMRIIQEALVSDDRVQAVENVVVEIQGDQITIRFTVMTAYGSFEQEVNHDVRSHDV